MTPTLALFDLDHTLLWGDSDVLWCDWLMRQGVLGIKVKIMMPHDPTGKNGPKTQLGDIIEIKGEKKAE